MNSCRKIAMMTGEFFILILCVLLLSACRSNEAINENELSGVEWVLTTYTDVQPITGHQPTIQLEVDQVSGTTGCNHYGGTFQIQGNSIQFDGIFSTEMACLEPDGLMDQEQGYLELLAVADQLELNNGSLTFFAKSAPILVFEAQSPIANQLQATLDEWRASSKIAGAVLAIDAPDQETLILVSGVSDIEAERPLASHDRFRIGSITKTFVAAVVLQLAQEGLLTLDDPLSAYVPEFPDAENITIRHLLSHQSGIFDFEFAPGIIEEAFQDPTSVWTSQDVIAAAISQEPHFAPGTGYAYSSTNFTLLGMIVEAVTGNSLNVEMSRRIFEPSGLTNTFLAGSEDVPEGIIHGYGTLPDGTNFDIAKIPNTAFDTATWATGSMVSSAGDLAHWAKTFYSGKGEIVDDEILDEMLAFEPSFGPTPSILHGLGVFRYETPVGLALGHTGTWFGFSSRMMYFPDLDVTLVVLVNQHFMDTSPIANAAMEIVTGASADDH